MKATIESTNKLVIVNGLQFRVWEGVSEKGTKFVALMNRIISSIPDDHKALVIETMAEHRKPDPTTATALEQLGV